ncbi:MAG: glycosyltransferase [Candidatus Eisenbacteria bacterium]|uniref:Glycosyltransferase n=1 Tax=Eiseniibacteriota bacterium TaxID=2212470 RepID=A0A538TH83_UNCEI|nr:MAG: glycosyltransferase [Candidatus Eisenbacteria bacterium]
MQARDSPPGDHAHAGARDLRGGGAGAKGGEAGDPRDHDSARRGPRGAAPPARRGRGGGAGGDAAARDHGPLHHRHDDRGAPRRDAGGRDRAARRLLLLRDQRSDADDVRLLAGRLGAFPARVRRVGHPAPRSLRLDRYARRGNAAPARRLRRPPCETGAQDRSLRRARRRSRLDRVLRGGGARLRFVQPLPDPARPSRGRAGRASPGVSRGVATADVVAAAETGAVKAGAIRVDAVIPAWNEAEAIALVLDALPRPLVRRIVVCDNGSTDGTAEIARAHGAVVVHEPRRGYGAACLRALAALEADPPDVVLFLDADMSDDPAEAAQILEPILTGRADLVIGSRTLGEREPGALTPQARFGNWLATRLLLALYGARFTDLGPFRAIRFRSLRDLGMRDRDFGWTVEMQIKAARAGLRTAEVPARYRRRIGRSKISGTVSGSVRAGIKILGTIAADFARRGPPRRPRPSGRRGGGAP